MKKNLLYIICLFLPLATFADNYQAGKDYIRIANGVSHSKQKEVMEFFSYGCPWCYELENSINNFRKNLPKGVVFLRIPVVFERGWDVYAKAYYTAKSLNLLDKMTPKIFHAIQEENKRLNKNKFMIEFFTENGVKKDIAENAFNISPTIKSEVKNGMMMMNRFGVRSVPTFVVNQTYRVDLQLAGGDKKRLFNIIRYLLKK